MEKTIFKKAITIILSSISILTASCSDYKGEEQMSTVSETTIEETETTHTYDKICALTFDDGPNITTTVQVLDKLEEYEIIGSFFLVGNNINTSTEEVVKRAYNMGCEINNHSKTHSEMNKMEVADIQAEIKYTNDKIEEITGEKPNFFRPPYIAVNNTMFENIDMTFISGYGANDWDDSVSAEERAEKVLNQAKDGCIILLHDMQGNSKTVEALDIIIPKMLEDGYEFVTVSEVFERKEIEPLSNIVYSYAEQTNMY